MNLKTLAWVFGVALLGIGVLGFVPALTPHGLLLGVFQVDALHNGIHLLSGLAAVVGAMAGAYYAKLYFMIFGVVYGLVTVLGFVTGYALALPGIVPVNMADNVLHVVIAGSALYIGFIMAKQVKTA